MIEAYKIGITLALKDDVSVGLAQIQKSLAATDQAVQGTGQHLTLLQRFGRDAAAPDRVRHAAPAMRLPTSEVSSQGEDDPARVAGTAASDAPARAQGLAARGFAAVAPEQRRGLPAREEGTKPADYSGEFAALGRRLATLGQAGQSVQPPAPVPVDQARGLHRALPMPTAPEMADIGRAISPASIEDGALPRPRERGPAAKSDIARERTPRVPMNAMPPIAEPARVSALSIAPKLQAEGAPPEPHGAEAVTQTRTTANSIAPIAVREMRPPSVIDPVMQAAREPLRREPEDQRGDDEAQIQHGELIIDGEVLGRWLVERMTRAMTRPPAGMTGFDPRMTPVYAGANIGI